MQSNHIMDRNSLVLCFITYVLGYIKLIFIHLPEMVSWAAVGAGVSTMAYNCMKIYFDYLKKRK